MLYLFTFGPLKHLFTFISLLKQDKYPEISVNSTSESTSEVFGKTSGADPAAGDFLRFRFFEWREGDRPADVKNASLCYPQPFSPCLSLFNRRIILIYRSRWKPCPPACYYSRYFFRSCFPSV